jgi:hypothetical protein
LLFRWGNPATYDSDSGDDRGLYFQHDPNWIPAGYPGEGHLLIFDNGGTPRPYSRIVEVAPVMDADGNYQLPAGEAAPAEVVWTYTADPVEDFYSPLISGAKRQPNGNTLITEGLNGRIFEVTTEDEIVWEYYLPSAAWAFRAERYDLPVFADFDMTQDLGFLGGIVWGQDCADGAQPRLHEYLPQENGDLNMFIDTYGDEAQAHREPEACAEHGGIAE